jgi:hypothetical protein
VNRANCPAAQVVPGARRRLPATSLNGIRSRVTGEVTRQPPQDLATDAIGTVGCEHETRRSRLDQNKLTGKVPMGLVWSVRLISRSRDAPHGDIRLSGIGLGGMAVVGSARRLTGRVSRLGSSPTVRGQRAGIVGQHR